MARYEAKLSDGKVQVVIPVDVPLTVGTPYWHEGRRWLVTGFSYYLAA